MGDTNLINTGGGDRMEESYWNKFMASGTVEDYLTYKGMEMCRQTINKYSRETAGMENESVKSDNRNGDDSVGSSYR